MTLGELSRVELAERLKKVGLILQIGPFYFRLISPLPQIQEGLQILYSGYALAKEGTFADFTVTIAEGDGVRRWLRKQCIFRFDGWEPFAPLPVAHALPLLEWAMNWCISMHAHQYLLLHSAVIEREGFAVILPAPPGSGKSTLCAGLIHRGWRLLSDELALISLSDASLTPLGRPVSLKNQSVGIVRAFEPSSVFSPVVHETSKGSVALMRVPQAHLDRIADVAHPRWVVFPKYVADSPPELTVRSKANSMLELGRNSFNYMVLGRVGFETLSKVIDASDCYDFHYSQLDDAVRVFDDLVAQRST